MTRSYTVDGITCNGCVAKVKSKLLHHPDVSAADVTLEGQKAVVTMNRPISVHELQESIGVDTKYKITEDVSPIAHPVAAAGNKTWLQTYKPLLLIGIFITGVAVIAAQGNLSATMINFMAGFFIVFSFFKLLDITAFASSYALYDLIARKVPAWGYAYPFVELALGLAYLTGVNLPVTHWATIAVMGISSVGVIQSVVRGERIQCACLGAVFNLPMSTVTIVEDLLMVGMAAGMLIA